MSEKQVPKGVWLYLSRLPVESTDKEIAAHFCECGMCVPVENVNVRLNVVTGATASAIVSVPPGEIMSLIRWALHQTDFHGTKLEVKRFGADSRGVNDGRL